ncbi:MAG: RluA family pseudouridine synthase [Bacteroidota bacterium]
MSSLPILHETRHWLAINKPAGLNVEQLYDYPSVEARVAEYLRQQGVRNPYVGIVHRLDRPVSGVLLVAKRKSALRHLNAQFAERRVQKTYWAITETAPAERATTLEHLIRKDQRAKRAEIVPRPQKGAVRGRLRYEYVQRTTHGHWLKVWPATGKFHQIRVQLAALGTPIIGDAKYGASLPDEADCIALHAAALVFVDPLNDQQLEITAPSPARAVWNNVKS